MMKKRGSVRRPSGQGEGVIDSLVPVSFITTSVLSRVGAEHDLSLSLIRVLGILRDRRPRMADLADYLGLERQTVSGLIARAEKRGLVRRVPNAEDGRATDVVLTAEGSRLVKGLYARTRESLEPFVDQLAPPDRRLLQSLLERMLESWNEPDARR